MARQQHSRPKGAVAVIGLGRFGKSLALELMAGGTAAQAASQILGQFDALGTGLVQLLPEGVYLARFFHLLHCLDHLL